MIIDDVMINEVLSAVASHHDLLEHGVVYTTGWASSLFFGSAGASG